MFFDDRKGGLWMKRGMVVFVVDWMIVLVVSVLVI